MVLRLARGLFSVSSVFPFDFFPDILAIDEKKVNIIYRYSWFSEQIHSILVDDITEVTVERNIIFATLKIVDGNNLRFPLTYSIRKLRIDDALRARRLIEGLIIAGREKIDLSKFLDKNTLLRVIENIGKMKGLE